METPTGVQSWMQGFTEVHRCILTLFGLPSDLYVIETREFAEEPGP
jgi:hypothetical protein